MKKKPDSSQNLIQQSVDIYVSLALITFFAYVSFTFVSPFISILLWAEIFAVSLYPLFMKLTQWLGGRAKLASILIAVFGLVFFLAPTIFITLSAVESAAHVVDDLTNGTIDIPAPHESIKSWPLIGEKAFKAWSDVHSNWQITLQQYLPQIKNAAVKIMSIGTSGLGSILQFALSIIFSSVFLIYAKPLSKAINEIAKRVDGNANIDFVKIAISTTRNISKGIIGVGFIQGSLASIGFFVIGMPFAGLWAAAAIGSSIFQVPALVILPSLIYVWCTKPILAASTFIAYMIPVMLLDNVLKPILMAKGLSTPMIIIFIGVIGGALSLGILGLFIGPVVLAVFYEMVRLWVKQNEA